PSSSSRVRLALLSVSEELVETLSREDAVRPERELFGGGIREACSNGVIGPPELQGYLAFEGGGGAFGAAFFEALFEAFFEAFFEALFDQALCGGHLSFLGVFALLVSQIMNCAVVDVNGSVEIPVVRHEDLGRRVTREALEDFENTRVLPQALE